MCLDQWKGADADMKKIGIISDTHGMLRPEVKEILRDCSYIFHAGDITQEEILDELGQLGGLYAVLGNNDRGPVARRLSRALSFELEGISFYMVHDPRDVTWKLDGVQVVVTGHTHHYRCEEKDGRLWLNPGSCGRSRFGGEVTMAVMTVENGEYEVEKIVL